MLNKTDGAYSPILKDNASMTINQNTYTNKLERFNPHNLKKVLAILEIMIDDEQVPIPNLGSQNEMGRVDFEAKNAINNLEPENSTYHLNIIESSMYFPIIEEILSEPRNKELYKAYKNLRKSINNKIPEIKLNKVYFFEVLNEIIDRFMNSNDIDLLENEMLLSVIIHFMYYICHIGEQNDNTK